MGAVMQLRVDDALAASRSSPRGVHRRATCDHDTFESQALAGLAKAPDARTAIADALARFDIAVTVSRSHHDGRAAMSPARKRFRRWTDGLAG